MKALKTSYSVFFALAATACGSTSTKDPQVSMPPADRNQAASAPEVAEEKLDPLHPTDGVIANAPGPLNFKLRCELEESGQISASGNCQRMKAKFGITKENPNAYLERSLLSHLTGFKSRILFTQGICECQGTRDR